MFVANIITYDLRMPVSNLEPSAPHTSLDDDNPLSRYAFRPPPAPLEPTFRRVQNLNGVKNHLFLPL